MKVKAIKTLTFILVALALSVNTGVFGQKRQVKTQMKVLKESTFKHEIPNLTDEQKAKIKELKIANMKVMLPLKNKIGEKRAHLRTLITAENIDMKAINKTIDEIGSIRTEMIKKKIANRMEIRKLLTEEQRLFFDTKVMRFENKRMHKDRGRKRMDRERFFPEHPGQDRD